MYLEDPIPVNISSVRLHGDLGRNDEYPLGFTRVVSGLDEHRDAHGGLREYLESISTTAESEAGGDTVPDMYTGPRGAESTSESVVDELSDEELYERAKAAGGPSPSSTARETAQHSRSTLVRKYALRRANGNCEGCGESAPFTTKQGDPYLEIHHLQELSDEGPDDRDTVAALCPTCHKRIHHGADGNAYNRDVAAKVGFDLSE